MTDAPTTYERAARGQGFQRVAGIDEAGRGPLAGPVVAAAVIIPEGFQATGITDSKRLSAAARERAYERIVEDCLFAIGSAEPDEIDRINILQATYAAMRRALAALPEPADFVLVDGLPVPNLHPHCRALVKGDSLSLSIAAASIVAKVTRDRILCEADKTYPQYGFAGHKGYGSAAHLAALAAYGPCPLHRRSFGPVAQQALRFDSI